MTLPTLSLEERISGGLFGLLVGDALGVPYELRRPDDLPPHEEIDFAPPAGFRRAHRGVAPGTWSDDGALALCLLASLLTSGSFDAEDFGCRLVRWRNDGYMAVDGVVFDVGVTTVHAIHALRAGAPPLDAGPAEESDNGNGSLMRVLPLALWHRGTDRDLVRDAQLQSRVTHGHLRSQVCCALYCLWARRTLEGVADAWNEAVQTLRDIYASRTNATRELERYVRPRDPQEGAGRGYVVDSLRSARVALQHPAFEDVVRAAVKMGNDTDTTACVAGGIAGIRGGLSSIPERWRTGLRGREILDPLLKQLLARVGG